MNSLFYDNILQAALNANIAELILNNNFIYNIKFVNQTNSQSGESINGWTVAVQIIYCKQERNFFIPIKISDDNQNHQLNWIDFQNAVFSAFSYFKKGVKKVQLPVDFDNNCTQILYEDYLEMCD